MTESENEPIIISLSVDPEVARQALEEINEALERWSTDSTKEAETQAIIAIQAMQQSNATLPEERVRDHLEISYDGSVGPKERAQQLAASIEKALFPDEK